MIIVNCVVLYEFMLVTIYTGKKKKRKDYIMNHNPFRVRILSFCLSLPPIL